MPTKVNLGLSRKAGLPDYGSIGASCHVELELDGQILDGDLDRFRQHVRRAYEACREAVEDELSREGGTTSPQSHVPHNGNGHGNGNGHQRTSGNAYPNGSNGHHRSNGRSATQSQVRAINAIAGRNRIDLSPILDRFGVQSLQDLSISDASSLIDELKGQPVGNGGGR